MGLADRDYARPGPRGGGGGWGGGAGLGGRGRFRLVSFNTWLIVINIAVFVLNNVLLATPNWWIPIRAGSGYYSDVVAADGTTPPVTDEMIARQYVDRSIQPPDPDQPRMFTYHPILDPTLAPTDRQGNPVSVPTGTGRIFGEIGRERIMYRPLLDGIGHFSTGKAFVDLQIWRFLTFQFLHANFMHLLFNMLGLWFVGGMVEARLGFKRYAAFYLLCGAAGAALYLVLNLLGYGLGARLPGVLFHEPYTPLVGASAGVFGILLAAAALYPREIVDVMFVIPMRLRTAVYIFTAIAAYNLLTQSANAGGEAAHLGGAAAGAYLIRRPHLLSDVVEFFRFSKRKGSRRPRSAGPGAARRAEMSRAQPGPDPERTEVDRILDKVHREGMASLTEREKDTLHRASEREGR